MSVPEALEEKYQEGLEHAVACYEDMDAGHKLIIKGHISQMVDGKDSVMSTIACYAYFGLVVAQRELARGGKDESVS